MADNRRLCVCCAEARAPARAQAQAEYRRAKRVGTFAPAPSTKMMIRSIDSIRSDFPALRRHEGGHPVAYFDGPGGTQVPQSVADAVSDYLLHHNANTHWAYPTSVETDALLADARVTFADFFNATPADVSFGNNMTTIAFHLAR